LLKAQDPQVHDLDDRGDEGTGRACDTPGDLQHDMARDDIEDLRRRMAQLEDEREIRYLLGRYGHYVDLGYQDAWVDQWSDHGAYDLVTVKRDGVGYDGAMRFEGKDQLRSLVQDPAARKLAEGGSLHIQDVNLVVRIDGDDACGHSYSITMVRNGKGVQIYSAAMVRWRFQRIEGRWRIAEKIQREVGDGSAFTDAPAITAFDAAKPAV